MKIRGIDLDPGRYWREIGMFDIIIQAVANEHRGMPYVAPGSTASVTHDVPINSIGGP